MQRLQKVFDVMEENNLSFEIGRYGQVFVIDSTDSRKEYCIKDVEEPNEPMPSIPPMFEYKVVIEKNDE